ncbi:MAG TPA: flavin reductase family protein, partial [Chitinophagaceae bacterium]|nr:flavin reductase family protein [Chitinophagaceae bacterium]
LASCEFPKGVNEFAKAGFTEIPATLVKPPMVKESLVNMECKVIEVKPLGTEGGAGNLVICEVLRMHIDDSLLDENKKIDQRKINHVARLGGDWYCVVNEQNLFQVEKPNTQIGIGVDALPENIRNSSLLTGNELGQLGNVHVLPDIDPVFEDDHLKQIILYYSLNPDEMEKELHTYAKKLLAAGKVKEAWQILLAG